MQLLADLARHGRTEHVSRPLPTADHRPRDGRPMRGSTPAVDCRRSHGGDADGADPWRRRIESVAIPAGLWSLVTAVLWAILGSSATIGTDGIHYLSIAAEGYEYAPGALTNVGYFPGYPLLIRSLMWVGIAPADASRLISLLAGCASAILFYEWMRLRGMADRERILALLVLLLFPFSLFLYGISYSESLFLALTLVAFVLVERDHVVAGCVAAGYATAVRPTGLVLCVAIPVLVLHRDSVLVGAALRWRRPSWRPRAPKVPAAVADRSATLRRVVSAGGALALFAFGPGSSIAYDVGNRARLIAVWSLVSVWASSLCWYRDRRPLRRGLPVGLWWVLLVVPTAAAPLLTPDRTILVGTAVGTAITWSVWDLLARASGSRGGFSAPVVVVVGAALLVVAAAQAVTRPVVALLLLVLVAAGARVPLRRQQAVRSGLGRLLRSAVGELSARLTKRPSLRPDRLRPRHLALLLVPMGLAGFVLYCVVAFGDAMAYVDVNNRVAGGRPSLSSLDAWWEVPAMLEVRDRISDGDLAMRVVQGVMLYSAVVASFFVRRRLGIGAGTYTVALVVMAVAVVVGFEASGRYLLMAFPLFALGGIWLSKRRLPTSVVVLGGSGAALGFLFLRFVEPLARTWNW